MRIIPSRPITATTTTQLWAKPPAGRRKKNATSVGKTTKKGKKNSNAKKPDRSNSNRPGTTQQQEQQQNPNQQQQQQKKKKAAPPWQVLSTKAAKQNIELEKQRREGIKAGILPTDATLDEIQPNSNKKPTTTLSKAFLDPASSKFINWRRFNPVSVPAGQRFVGAYLDQQLPPRLGVPEIAFLGRSNVGKSSLLNRLSMKASGDQARVGKTPGATASVNLYVLQDSKERDLLGWVDLPGFGYAKLSRDTKESVQRAAEAYLQRRRELALGILLVDVRRTPSDDDRAVLAALYDQGVPVIVVATKRDKLSSSHTIEQQLRVIRDGLGLPEGQPLAVSSVTGEGCRELWRILLEACEMCVAEFKSQYDETTAAALLEESEHDVDDDNDEYYDDDDSAEDFAYSQGYDWIHGDPVLYEGDEGYDYEDDGDDDGYNNNGADEDNLEAPSPVRETLKSLKKKARDMERRGEV